MTSKEALETIGKARFRNNSCEPTIHELYISEYETIKKDLELLNSIKTYYEMNGFDELIPIYKDDAFEVFEKIRKWLENNK